MVWPACVNYLCYSTKCRRPVTKWNCTAQTEHLISATSHGIQLSAVLKTLLFSFLCLLSSCTASGGVPLFSRLLCVSLHCELCCPEPLRSGPIGALYSTSTSLSICSLGHGVSQGQMALLNVSGVSPQTHRNTLYMLSAQCIIHRFQALADTSMYRRDGRLPFSYTMTPGAFIPHALFQCQKNASGYSQSTVGVPACVCVCLFELIPPVSDFQQWPHNQDMKTLPSPKEH